MQFFTENQDQKIYIKFAGGFSLYKGIISPKDVKAKYVFFNDTFRLMTKKRPKNFESYYFDTIQSYFKRILFVMVV